MRVTADRLRRMTSAILKSGGSEARGGPRRRPPGPRQPDGSRQPWRRDDPGVRATLAGRPRRAEHAREAGEGRRRHPHVRRRPRIRTSRRRRGHGRRDRPLPPDRRRRHDARERASHRPRRRLRRASCAAGLVSLHFVNVADHRGLVAPFRGSDARFSTNPVCIALPGTDRQPPLLLDMATSAVAMGKVRVAKNEGKPLAEGIAIDPAGRPTRDPNVLYSEPRGALLPFGGHKGYALAVVTDAGRRAVGRAHATARERTPGRHRQQHVRGPGRPRAAGRRGLAPSRDRRLRGIRQGLTAGRSEAPVLVPGDPERQAREERPHGNRRGRHDVGRDPRGRRADGPSPREPRRSPVRPPACHRTAAPSGRSAGRRPRIPACRQAAPPARARCTRSGCRAGVPP